VVHKKRGTLLLPISLPIIDNFQNSFTGTLCGQFAKMWLFYVIHSYFTYMSQGSVATHLCCGGIYNNHIIANCLQSVPMKELWKSVNNYRRYGQKQSATFFLCTTLYKTTDNNKHRKPLPVHCMCLLQVKQKAEEVTEWMQSTSWSIKTCHFDFLNSFVKLAYFDNFWHATSGKNLTQMAVVLATSL